MAKIFGTSGEDILDGTDEGDFIFGWPYPSRPSNDQSDVLSGLGGNDKIYGGAGNDKIYGGPGDDRLDGMDGDDQIFGGPGNDDIFGGGGNNILAGGPGRDTLTGSSSLKPGTDTFQYGSGDGRDTFFIDPSKGGTKLQLNSDLFLRNKMDAYSRATVSSEGTVFRFANGDVLELPGITTRDQVLDLIIIV